MATDELASAIGGGVDDFRDNVQVLVNVSPRKNRGAMKLLSSNGTATVTVTSGVWSVITVGCRLTVALRTPIALMMELAAVVTSSAAAPGTMPAAVPS